MKNFNETMARFGFNTVKPPGDIGPVPFGSPRAYLGELEKKYGIDTTQKVDTTAAPEEPAADEQAEGEEPAEEESEEQNGENS
jgi:hypothetical protein